MPRNEATTGTPDEWLAAAQQHEGSWWTDWRRWIGDYLGKEVPPRVPGKGKLKVIEAAPGAYARLRADG